MVTNEKSQTAAFSGGTNISKEDRNLKIEEIRSLAEKYGLQEVRDEPLEKTISDAEKRYVYSAAFSKNGEIGLYLSNDISEERFTYIGFKEPFSELDYNSFRSEFIEVIDEAK